MVPRLHDFAESEIRQLDVPGACDENVFRLEVAIGDGKVVQILDGADELGAVKPHRL